MAPWVLFFIILYMPEISMGLAESHLTESLQCELLPSVVHISVALAETLETGSYT